MAVTSIDHEGETRGSDRVLTPQATFSRRLYDLAGGNVFYDGERASDKYAAWNDGHGLPAVFFGQPAGEYAVKAKGVSRVGDQVPDIAGLWTRWGGGLSLALVAGKASPLRWSGVAYHVPSARQYPRWVGGRHAPGSKLLDDPADVLVADVWCRTDGVAGLGDHDDPLFTNVRYRPLWAHSDEYDGLAVWADLSAAAAPFVVRAHHDKAVALIMPVRAGENVVHTTWAEG
jgi:hypothetical protein